MIKELEINKNLGNDEIFQIFYVSNDKKWSNISNFTACFAVSNLWQITRQVSYSDLVKPVGNHVRSVTFRCGIPRHSGMVLKIGDAVFIRIIRALLVFSNWSAITPIRGLRIGGSLFLNRFFLFTE